MEGTSLTPNQEDQILREALRRGFVNEATLAGARAEAARLGRPILHLLSERVLTPQQLAHLRSFASDSGRIPQPEPSAPPPESWSGGLPPTGARLGRYVLERLLGKGGMGAVYVGRDLNLDRSVAIKVMLPTFSADDDSHERFVREAEALGAARHPNVVVVHETGTHSPPAGPPVHFLVLELVDGESLGDRLARDGPLPPRVAAELLLPLARALQFAHEAGVLHRDLKPDNVLVAVDGTPKLADFGLARLVDREALTLTGQVLGTPAYMSPEQASGEPGRFGPHTDVYGLGAVLYALLTGKPPFEGRGLAVLKSVLFDAPRAPSAVNAALDAGELETICTICLEKEPEDRYLSAAALGADLEFWLRGEPIRRTPLTRAQRLKRRLGRNRFQVAAAVAILFAGVAAATYKAVVSVKEEPTATLAEADPLELARAALETGQPLKAIDLLAGLRERAPAQALLVQAYALRARELEGEGDWEGVARALGASLEVRPTLEAHRRRALALDRLLRLEEAEVDLCAAAALLGAVETTNPETTAKRDLECARLLSRGLDVAGAQRSCEAVVAAHPASGPRASRQLRGEARLLQGWLETEHGDFKLALSHLAEAKDLLPEDHRPHLAEAIAYLNRANPWQLRGEKFDAAQRLCPKAEASVVELHRIVQLLARPATAGQAQKAFAALLPVDTALYHATNAWQLLAADPAIQVLATRIMTNGSLAKASAAEREAAAPTLHKAEVAVRKSLALDPRSHRGWASRTAIFLYRDDRAASLASCLVAQRLFSAAPNLWFYRACLERDKDPAAALKSLDRALELRPQFFAARWLRLTTRIEERQLEEARADARVLLPYLSMWVQTLGLTGTVNDATLERGTLVVERLVDLDMKAQAVAFLGLLRRKLSLVKALTPQRKETLDRLQATLR
jgi:tetratricopeptide (TPR) repeat protein